MQAFSKKKTEYNFKAIDYFQSLPLLYKCLSFKGIVIKKYYLKKKYVKASCVFYVWTIPDSSGTVFIEIVS